MEKIGQSQNKYLGNLGSRIRSELNDLKRTPKSAAKDLGFSEEFVNSILSGAETEKNAIKFINRMGEVYPIDSFPLHLLKSDTCNGIKFVANTESERTKRVYKRVDSEGNKLNYYEYRDTAMSKLAPFKPEWIEVLKEVENSDPYNLKVVMNNGHFLHQTTLFIGPVNFYYNDEYGMRQCCEMKTGDSNYIPPFLKHSFASRDSSEFTCIIAVTFGGDVSRSQRELYALGENKLKSFLVVDDFKSLVKYHMQNNLLSLEVLDLLIRQQDKTIDIKEIIRINEVPSMKQLQIISLGLGVGVNQLIPSSELPGGCVIKKTNSYGYFLFPCKKSPLYKIYYLANRPESNLMKNSVVEVLTRKHHFDHCFERSMHSYLINYYDHPVQIKWLYDGVFHYKEINKFDSVYLEPFTKFSFVNLTEQNGKLLIVGVASSINLQTQRELTGFIEPERSIKELETWYGKK